MRKIISEEKLDAVKKYLSENDRVAIAFVFGSFATNNQTDESDFDIAVYLKPDAQKIEIEEPKRYPIADDIWLDIEKILEIDVDFIILNQAYPSFIYSVFKKGIPLVIKDEKLYQTVFEFVERETFDFDNFMEDFLKIKLRSSSLSVEDKIRLLKRIDFLIDCISEKEKFIDIQPTIFKDKPDDRRNIEKWIEDIANCTIDISKIILASEKKEIPRSYKECLINICLFFEFKEEEARKFSRLANLRNILAHEYLDVLYQEIRIFLDNILPVLEKIIPLLCRYTNI